MQKYSMQWCLAVLGLLVLVGVVVAAAITLGELQASEGQVDAGAAPIGSNAEPEPGWFRDAENVLHYCKVWSCTCESIAFLVVFVLFLRFGYGVRHISLCRAMITLGSVLVIFGWHQSVQWAFALGLVLVGCGTGIKATADAWRELCFVARVTRFKDKQ